VSIEDYLMEHSKDETDEFKLKAEARGQILGAFVEGGLGYHSANRKQDSTKVQLSN
jgi:hypothetical protein